MGIEESKRMILALANGVDPLTGEVLPDCNTVLRFELVHPQLVVRFGIIKRNCFHARSPLRCFLLGYPRYTI